MSFSHLNEDNVRTLENLKKVMIWQSKGSSHAVDFILHHAALNSGPHLIKDPRRFNKANIDGFLKIWVAAGGGSAKSIVAAASGLTCKEHPDLPKVENKIG